MSARLFWQVENGEREACIKVYRSGV